ncbi:hypothetical protein GIB67_020792 [Kingdonia uniflora]|uniref:Uncharacterized protein n=1 Tax=Kingdonia uniflora TaxID=39325 RepID=A0A7J7M751_9MAGN|nr:hypothetical protein GIB67_020792 [Kingdonia uniflora]
MEQNLQTKLSPPLTSIFMTTVNMAMKMLANVTSNTTSTSIRQTNVASNTTSTSIWHGDKWKAADHLRYMAMLSTWVTVWVLRVLIDHFPCSLVPTSHYGLGGFPEGGEPVFLSSSAFPMISSDLLLHEGFSNEFDWPSTKALGRALSHIFTLINEIPVTSRKYEFAIAMADKIVDENARDGHMALLEVNRVALTSAFDRTANQLYWSLQSSHLDKGIDTWSSKIFCALPFGYFLKGLAGALLPDMYGPNDKLTVSACVELRVWFGITSHNCKSQSARLYRKDIGDFGGRLARGNTEVLRQVKFRLLFLWLPLFCYASNGISYPILSGCEKVEIERMIEEVISSLPVTDQEIILKNWFQDFCIISSDWPNLQNSYDQWCRASRKLLA